MPDQPLTPQSMSTAPGAPMMPPDSSTSQLPPPGIPGQPESTWKKPCLFSCLGCLGFLILLVGGAGYVAWKIAGPVYTFMQDANVAISSGKPEALLTLTTPAFQTVTPKEELAAALASIGKISSEGSKVTSVDFKDGRGILHIDLQREDGTTQPITIWVQQMNDTWRIDGVALQDDQGPPRPGISP